MADLNPQDKLTKARAALVLSSPFFGALALRLRPAPTEKLAHAGTNGRELHYNPDYINGLTLEQTKALWAEEVLHCGLAHHVRRGDRDLKQWNRACDQAIFHALHEAGFVLPPDSRPDSRYQGKSAEEIYTLLAPVSPQDDNQGGGWGDVLDGTDDNGQRLTHADADQAEADWKVALQQAAQQAKAMGNLPGDLARMVENHVNPKLPWQEILRLFVERAARNDYAWNPPNRRYLQAGFYLPSLKSDELADIVIAVDTSGSVSNADLAVMAGEITGVLDAFETTVHVVYCDTRVTHTETFTREDMPLTLDAKGGGGTDFRPPFQWVEEQGLEPVALIYLTDMDCNRYPAAPDYPVLWVKIGDWPTATPPFGELVEMPLP
jgi:predicted metal-dependent peptidase